MLSSPRVCDWWQPPEGCDWWRVRKLLDEQRMEYSTFTSRLPNTWCMLRVFEHDASVLAGGWLLLFDHTTGRCVERRGYRRAVAVPTSRWDY